MHKNVSQNMFSTYGSFLIRGHKLLQIFAYISNTLPPFKMKFSQVSLIVYIYIYIGLN